MQVSDLCRHAARPQVIAALNRYNLITNAALSMRDTITPMIFAKIVHLLNHDAFHALPTTLQGSTTRLLRSTPGTICGLSDRGAPTEESLATPRKYLGRQNITTFIDAADQMVMKLDHLDDIRMEDLAFVFCRVLWMVLVEMNRCELARLAGTPRSTVLLDGLGGKLASIYQALIALSIEINLEQAREIQLDFTKQLEGYRKKEEKERWKKDDEEGDEEGGSSSSSEKESGLPPGCIAMTSNCPVRGLPSKLYRWQSFSPKNGINLPDDDKGIPTAVNGKVAFAMGAISTDFLVEIDRDLLIKLIGSDAVKQGFYSVVGSRKAGWEFKLWVAVPQGAISTIWAKGIAPAKHKPKNL